jgi:cobyric acid synthase
LEVEVVVVGAAADVEDREEDWGLMRERSREKLDMTSAIAHVVLIDGFGSSAESNGCNSSSPI